MQWTQELERLSVRTRALMGVPPYKLAGACTSRVGVLQEIQCSCPLLLWRDLGLAIAHYWFPDREDYNNKARDSVLSSTLLCRTRRGRQTAAQLVGSSFSLGSSRCWSLA